MSCVQLRGMKDLLNIYNLSHLATEETSHLRDCNNWGLISLANIQIEKI